jgi:hypothetical protein
MSAARLDLVIEQGATWTVPLTWEADGAPVDLTGWSARLQVRASHAHTSVLLELTSAGGGIALGGAAGTVTPGLDAAATAGLTWSTGVYDLELVAPGGAVTRLTEGRVTVRPEVTR